MKSFLKNEQTVHCRLQEIRKDRKMTQAELAEKAGVTRQTIISIEKGKYAPSLSLALCFAKIFNVSVEEIFWL